MGLSISAQTVTELRECAVSLKQSNDMILDSARAMVEYYQIVKPNLGPHVEKMEEDLALTYDTGAEASEYVDEMVVRLQNLATQIEEYVNNTRGEE